ncbi:hypothetical protein HKX54_03815 [Sulfitobacter sp. M57]|uniref:hypothetical protein n=1 Tax=unclassified Sulfitobacter TaxID=196795 RepID=UPI0023E2AC16|nr:MULTISPECIES: hypothetical protein [unclassified Sulfitobacter]MDF3413570.1 hypothetical protein [Sulfitobacter sp. KE5]MDF3421148.1 hypothetical protein [Sulfitobacter sp. KE43]MDF3432117.1 hypothetical protein [Sulfitobacter sp. KE42]MDF3457757.1 hypothetical protein [Sulfitobacter sp. S74]MDF3461658.1 hypothetical protein [Sulfitobacter sp. Ks18]
MRKTIPLLLAATLGLGACSAISQSRVNPVNWFGKSRAVPVEQVENTNPLIPQSGGLFSNDRAKEAIYDGRPFDQVTDLKIERVPGGAIIRATGLAARQGIYAVQLTPENEEELPVDGVLTYRLEGIRPTAQTAIGTKPTREVIAARHVTDQQLAGVRRIRVEGQRNAQVARR